MSEEQMTNQDIQETTGVAIPIRWGTGEQAPTFYANQLFISHTGNEFYLVFGELSPIISLDKQDDLPDYLEIKPVVKIAVSPPNMVNFTKAIQENMGKLVNKKPLPIEMSDEDTE